MKRYMIIGAIGLLMILMIAAWASSCQAPLFKGFYQSEMINGEVVQMSIYNDENKFVEFITNREVNQGTYRLTEEGIYEFDGDELDFTAKLRDDNSFEIFLPKLDGAKPIVMKNISEIPAGFGDAWEDEDEYKNFLR